MITENEAIEQMRKPILWLGMGLVATGAGALLFIAYIVIQVIRNPAESGLVTWLVETIGSETFFVSGQVNENTFDIQTSVVFQYLFYGIIALILVGILSSVVNGLITGGIKLITFSGTKFDHIHK